MRKVNSTIAIVIVINGIHSKLEKSATPANQWPERCDTFFVPPGSWKNHTRIPRKKEKQEDSMISNNNSSKLCQMNHCKLNCTRLHRQLNYHLFNGDCFLLLKWKEKVCKKKEKEKREEKLLDTHPRHIRRYQRLINVSNNFLGSDISSRMDHKVKIGQNICMSRHIHMLHPVFELRGRGLINQVNCVCACVQANDSMHRDTRDKKKSITYAQ